MMRKEGRIAPNAKAKAPGNFFSLYPMKMEMLTANTPGTDCDTAKRSIKSSCMSHLFLLTTSSSMRGTMAYPPPMVNNPILKKVQNASI